MQRRPLIALGVAAAGTPRLPRAQERPKRLGFLLGLPNESQSVATLSALDAALRAQGLLEGPQLQFIVRHAGNDESRLDQAAADLVRAGADVIVAAWSPAAHAARRATATTPIVVLAAGDPVATGLAKSLAQPGGNVTGVASMSPELTASGLGLLREWLPALRRIGALTLATDPFTPTLIRAIEQAAASLSIEVHASPVRPGYPLGSVFRRWADAPVDAVFVQPTLDAVPAIALARTHRMASFSFVRAFARAGGLMAYTVDGNEISQRVAAIVQRVLAGANPAEIPIEQPTRFRLVINAATANAIGLPPPKSILLRAAEVIR